jgi:RecB family exonuclease
MLLEDALRHVGASRRADPLAPVTFVAPTRIAALALRRELARHTPYAAVRFETLPRLAELIGAGQLAARDKKPLARPIGDYAAGVVAKRSSGVFQDVSQLPGYARVLRRHFQRLRRGGIRRSTDVLTGSSSPGVREFLRAYDAFRALTADFYDDEDLFGAAVETVRERRGGVAAELGAVYIVPPGPWTAGSAAFMTALATTWTVVERLDDNVDCLPLAIQLMPDATTETENVARDVIRLLEQGAAIHEVAVFHGADPAYPALLASAFKRAQIPATRFPGQPLLETPAGRAALALTRLPAADYSRVAVMDFLALAQTPAALPAEGETVAARSTTWDRLSRAAGVTHGEGRWRAALTALAVEMRERGQTVDDGAWRSRIEDDAVSAEALIAVIQELARRLEPLRVDQPARRFITALKSIVSTYVRAGAHGFAEVMEEIDQLGTVGAIGGTFSLETFIGAFEANLRQAAIREGSLGQGVLIADYRSAAGLHIPHVVVCGAYEGAFPSGGTVEAVIDDGWWKGARSHHPFVEDAAARLERDRAAVRRCLAAATGSLTVTVPLTGAAGTHDFYPAPIVAEAAGRNSDEIVTPTQIRSSNHAATERFGSPLSCVASGPVLDAFELELRESISLSQNALRTLTKEHRLARPLDLRRARRASFLSDWDGLVKSELTLLPADRQLSATSIEAYAACGFKFLCRSILRLQVPETPEERETMDPAVRGTVVHRVLNRFFTEQQQRGRPALDEAWDDRDLDRLLEMLEHELANARALGQAGLPIFHAHEEAVMRADLERFLVEDSLDRQARRARPSRFEFDFSGVEIAGRRFRGAADRIDYSDDGSRAWVIDYKTGGASSYQTKPDDPFNGGQQLQLAIYAAALGAPPGVTVAGRYWFISQRGGFATADYEHSPENAERLSAVIRAILSGVQEGSFPSVPGDESIFGGFENCRYCDFDRICSRRRLADFTARAEHETLRPWSRVMDVAKGVDVDD